MALMWGTVSAVSLPAGAAVGIVKYPGDVVIAVLLAFGGGTLIFALTLELFGEAMTNENATTVALVGVLAPAAFIGGVFFFVLNKLTNWQSTKKEIAHAVLQIEKYIKEHGINKACNRAFHFVFRCSCCKRENHDIESVPILHPHDDLGPVGNLIHTPALPEPMEGPDSPTDEMEAISHPAAHQPPQSYFGVAIWLGILLDGIPESIYIGIMTCSDTGMSPAFIVGVFMSNLPEALSAAANMREHGMSRLKIMLMWGSLCLGTGFGACITALALPYASSGWLFYFELCIEGLAAGAMLTMVAQTVLPEAYFHAQNLSGLSTLLGFLTAFLIDVTLIITVLLIVFCLIMEQHIMMA
ncbi:metal cation transporter, ZIP subfamily protein [Pelomyxa schiedti]|nr:metal cation transporter, ZIP subfamily protein [Pelomyxa schiedti]